MARRDLTKQDFDFLEQCGLDADAHHGAISCDNFAKAMNLLVEVKWPEFREVAYKGKRVVILLDRHANNLQNGDSENDFADKYKTAGGGVNVSMLLDQINARTSNS